MSEPTAKQLSYLRQLGYTGSAPLTAGEASELISGTKDGVDQSHLEKGMLDERARKGRTKIENAKHHLAMLESMKKDWMGEFKLAGFRLKVLKGAETQANAPYKNAFLPFDVAKRYPELLTISGLDYDSELQRRPSKGPIVIAPGQIGEIESQGSRQPAVVAPIGSGTEPKKSGCLVLFALLGSSLVALAAVLIMLVAA